MNEIVLYQPDESVQLLEEKSNLHFLQTPNSDRPTRLYDLDVIISVGCRKKCDTLRMDLNPEVILKEVR